MLRLFRLLGSGAERKPHKAVWEYCCFICGDVAVTADHVEWKPEEDQGDAAPLHPWVEELTCAWRLVVGRGATAHYALDSALSFTCDGPSRVITLMPLGMIEIKA